MTDWRFEHSVVAYVPRDVAWAFWTDVSNWSLDAAVDSVVLDGPFGAGSRGTTRPKQGDAVHWVIREASLGAATIEIELPGATVHFQWRFVGAGGDSTNITQSVTLSGPGAQEFVGMANEQLAPGIPEGMRKLVEAMEGALG